MKRLELAELTATTGALENADYNTTHIIVRYILHLTVKLLRNNLYVIMNDINKSMATRFLAATILLKLSERNVTEFID